jgi:K+-sensing histidine kinase KdpD
MALLDFLKKWLVATPKKGKSALVLAVLAIGLPTILRASLDGIVVETGLLPYLPFVMLAAILLDWKAATIIMLVATVLADWLFIAPHHRLLEEPADVFAVAMFLIGSTLTIALVHAIRTALTDLVGPTSKDGVIFSLKEEQAWASWPEAGFHLRLGPQGEVASMMEDFLAQLELAERLAAAAQAKAPHSACE